MCGRFSLGLPNGIVHQVRGWDVRPRRWINEQNFHPRHNIAPHSNAVVLRRREPREPLEPEAPETAPDNAVAGPSPSTDDAPAPDDLLLQTMRWGLVPHWSKYEDKKLQTTNARAENLVNGGGLWGSIKGRKRCAVLCEGYYEWLKKGSDRIPHFTRPTDGEKLMLLAGLYDCVVLEGQTEPMWTFTIVTTDANAEFSWLHDRQPVILSSVEALSTWLDTSTHVWTPALTALVRPYSDAAAPLLCYQVPKEVGKVGTESSTFIEPVAERKDGIRALFGKQAAKPPSASPVKIRPASSSPNKLKRRRSNASPSPADTNNKGEGSSHPSPLKKSKVGDTGGIKQEDDEVEFIGTSQDGTSTARHANEDVQIIPSKFKGPAKPSKPTSSKGKKPRKST